MIVGKLFFASPMDNLIKSVLLTVFAHFEVVHMSIMFQIEYVKNYKYKLRNKIRNQMLKTFKLK